VVAGSDYINNPSGFFTNTGGGDSLTWPVNHPDSHKKDPNVDAKTSVRNTINCFRTSK
jgi:hypothetical protein